MQEDSLQLVQDIDPAIVADNSSLIARILDKAGTGLREGNATGHLIVATGTAAFLGLGFWAWSRKKNKAKSSSAK